MNLCEYLINQIKRRPDAEAILRIQNGDATITYSDLEKRIKRVAAWLDERGIGEDDRVAIYMPNCPAYVPLVFGIWHVGAVVSPLNTRFGVDDLAFVLEDIRPTVLFTSETLADETDDLEPRIESLEYTTEIEHTGEFAEFPAAAEAPPRTKRLDGDTAIIMHTSGTTGDPKGVVQTHRNIGAQVDSGISVFGLRPDDTALVAMPLFHVGGLHGPVLMSLFSGGSVAVMPGWDAEEWLHAIENTGATYTGLVPTMMVDALDTIVPEKHDTSSLRFCFFGGAPAPEPLLEEFEDTFEVDLSNYYGQTENAGVSITLDPGEKLPIGSLGRLTPAVRGKVIDIDTGEEVPSGDRGELLLRGDIITPGYWERPERNEALFTDGWLHTEDIVRQDKDGYLYYVDRKDDIIHSGGEKVPPSRVENVLQDMTGVESVAVFGTDHKRWGEAVTATVIGDDLTEEAVKTFCESRDDLPEYMKPRRVVFVEEFPRTGSQKIDKVALAKQVDF
ncbi:AMP-binding protein [Natrinema sp. 1APR25-10V2]|uniref:class I adenylate-forming enzyme family protein n=1 Tax=Natrinema sp. 1APR25-10V2 TaxID=2951081 RepID=UPI0028744F30|nr:AMP-binding protein [Natrinema sp. 1APR25-10V2]MDS0476946.1 AMP-binding protein [Natrinema sp. 1APR25-10V2]